MLCGTAHNSKLNCWGKPREWGWFTLRHHFSLWPHSEDLAPACVVVTTYSIVPSLCHAGMTWLPLDSSGVVRLQRNCGTHLNPLKCEKMIIEHHLRVFKPGCVLDLQFSWGIISILPGPWTHTESLNWHDCQQINWNLIIQKEITAGLSLMVTMIPCDSFLLTISQASPSCCMWPGSKYHTSLR